MGFTSLCFIITPDELREMIRPVTLFVSNTHVPEDYCYTPDAEFIKNYTEVYLKLRRGEKIDKRTDHGILKHYSYTTDISSVSYGKEHFYEEKKYKLFVGSDRGFPPYFGPFAAMLSVEKGKVSLSTRVSDSIGDIIGYELVFPNKAEAACYGLVSEKDWQSYSDYLLCSEFVKSHTSPLTLSVNNAVKRTSIRVSEEVKSFLPDFDFVKQYGITIL